MVDSLRVGAQPLNPLTKSLYQNRDARRPVDSRRGRAHMFVRRRRWLRRNLKLAVTITQLGSPDSRRKQAPVLGFQLTAGEN